jgi:hypothetical protein
MAQHLAIARTYWPIDLGQTVRVPHGEFATGIEEIERLQEIRRLSAV